MHSKTFIHQLHHILQQDELKEWIRWSNEENGVFLIKPNAPDFSKKVLKRFFKHGNVSSFVRQLHMYGFNKQPQNGSGNVWSTGASETSKSEVEWKFSHHSQHFCKDATEDQLKRIHRKSNNIGKDGRRKNLLSPVCVNYLASLTNEQSASRSSLNSNLNLNLPTDGRKTVPLQSQPTQNQHITMPSVAAGFARTDTSNMRESNMWRQRQQFIPQNKNHSISSVPGLNTNVGVTAPFPSFSLPAASPIPRISHTPSYVTPYSSFSYRPGESQYAINAQALAHYEQNLSLLNKTMIQVCDALMAPDRYANECLEKIRMLQVELNRVECNWNALYPPKDSSSSPTSTFNRFDSMTSAVTQQSSIFSNTRLSDLQKMSTSSVPNLPNISTSIDASHQLSPYEYNGKK